MKRTYLTEGDRAKIRELYRGGMTGYALAELYGVSSSLIYVIAAGTRAPKRERDKPTSIVEKWKDRHSRKIPVPNVTDPSLLAKLTARRA